MSRQTSSASLHILQPRAPVPGGTREQREREFMRQEGPYLIRTELERIRPVDPAPNNLLNRICQAIDVLFNRGHVYVERRHPRRP
jgi:hypothetical protein